MRHRNDFLAALAGQTPWTIAMALRPKGQMPPRLEQFMLTRSGAPEPDPEDIARHFSMAFRQD